MREWKATLYDTPLPDGATIEDRGSEFGFLGGNGNHCDFLAWVVLGTELSDRRVEAHYENALNHLEFGLVTAETVSPGRVRVELFDSREAGWDLRCH